MKLAKRIVLITFLTSFVFLLVIEFNLRHDRYLLEQQYKEAYNMAPHFSTWERQYNYDDGSIKHQLIEMEMRIFNVDMTFSFYLIVLGAWLISLLVKNYQNIVDWWRRVRGKVPKQLLVDELRNKVS